MEKEIKAYKGCGLVILAFVLLSIVLNVWLWHKCNKPPERIVVHDTVWNDTTIYKPIPKDSTMTGRIVYLRIPYPVEIPGDTIHDSIEVPVPIEQKIYEDSLYTAWVSGYNPALDSINLRLPEITTTITETIVKPAPRLSVGLQVGAGVGLLQHRPDVYVGIGINWRIWPR